jgi:tetratricopeptide (TPR) repeat protein
LETEEAASEEEAEVPDWLRDLEAEPEEAEAAEALSGDDALAWLESLTVGKEEELRAQAETERRARVDEIMGRKPSEEAALAEEAEAPEAEVAEVVEAEVEEAEVEEMEALAAAAEALEVEVVEAGVDVEEAPVPVAVEEAESETAVIEVTKEAAPAIAQEVILEDEFFGWSSFSDQRVELGGGMLSLVPSVAVIGETFFGWSSFDVDQIEFGQDIKIEVPDVQESEIESEVEAEPLAEEVIAKPEVSIKTREELDALREQVRQDRSDHEARLALARALWVAGTYKESLDHYGRLINEGFELERMLGDLQRYAEEHPDDPNLLRTLGDVYMKQSLLDEAMNFYKEAMALL